MTLLLWLEINQAGRGVILSMRLEHFDTKCPKMLGYFIARATSSYSFTRLIWDTLYFKYSPISLPLQRLEGLHRPLFDIFFSLNNNKLGHPVSTWKITPCCQFQRTCEDVHILTNQNPIRMITHSTDRRTILL